MTQTSPFSNLNKQEQPDSIHSFIVKIWLEETRAEAGKIVWRGHITHVPSNHRAYFRYLEEIPIFILPYLDDMNIEGWRLGRLLRCLKVCLPHVSGPGSSEPARNESGSDDADSDRTAG